MHYPNLHATDKSSTQPHPGAEQHVPASQILTAHPVALPKPMYYECSQDEKLALVALTLFGGAASSFCAAGGMAAGFVLRGNVQPVKNWFHAKFSPRWKKLQAPYAVMGTTALLFTGRMLLKKTWHKNILWAGGIAACVYVGTRLGEMRQAAQAKAKQL